MTYTLNLFDEVLSRARRMEQASQLRQAQALLQRLLGFRDLPAAVAEEAEARLGEILLKRRRYLPARRHLLAALRHSPDCARYHFLLGLALHSDPDGDRERAARCYRRSLELAPGQLRCRGEAGLLAIELGQVDEGLALLRQAVEQAPGDAGAVGRLVKGLCRSGRPDEALEAVQTARFHASRCPRLHKLWTDLHLTGLRREQEMTAAQQAEDEGPCLLPFVAHEAASAVAAGLRLDDAVALPGPHRVGVRERMERRRAP